MSSLNNLIYIVKFQARQGHLVRLRLKRQKPKEIRCGVTLGRGKRIKGPPGLYSKTGETMRMKEDKPDLGVIPATQKVEMDVVVLRKHKAKQGGGGAGI